MSDPKKDGEPEFESCSVIVAVRCRPFNERERLLSSKPCIEFYSPKDLRIHNGPIPPPGTKSEHSNAHPFAFDFAYDMNVPQEKVFLDIGKPVLNASFAGFNTCIFAYGQTGSGKSHTMMGPGGGKDTNKDPGLIPRICTTLFKEIADRELDSENKIRKAIDDGVPEHERPPHLAHEVHLTYLEIYQEKVKCLLNPKKENLRVRQHPKLGVFVEDLTQMEVTNYSEVYEYIEGGNNVRTVAATNMNERSSRSHAIFSLIVTQRRTFVTKVGENVSERISKVNLVDLAGSERAKATGAEGEQLREGSNINKSLTTLGLVISGLAEQSKQGLKKQVFVPYRDSTLTWMLKENLGGNSKTFMLSALSPADVNYEETISTLRYADRAKAIVTKACINEDPNLKLIRELREELTRYKEMMQGFQSMQKSMKNKPATESSSAGEESPSATTPTSKIKIPKLALGGSASGKKAKVQSDSEADEDDEDEWEQEPHGAHQFEQMQRQATMAEALLNQLAMSPEDRKREQEREMKDRAEAMKVVSIKADRSDPYLMNLEGGGDWVIEYLIDDVTYVGAKPLENPAAGARLILIQHDDILEQHCCFLKNPNGSILLRPLPGANTFVDDSEHPLTNEYLLSPGQTIQIGEYVNVKFVDKSAPLMSSRKSRMNFAKGTAPSPFQPKPIQKIGAGSPPMSIPTQPQFSTPKQATADSVENNAASQTKVSPSIPKLALGGSTPQQQTTSTEGSSPPPSVPKLALGGAGLGGAPAGPPSIPKLHLDPLNPQGLSKAQVSQQPPTASTTMNSSFSKAPNSARGLSRSSQPVAAIRTPRINSQSYSAQTAEDMVAVNRHLFVVLGDCHSGKSSLRACLAKDAGSFPFALPWLSKKVPETVPTLGFETSTTQAGSLGKADVTFLELSGCDSFAFLQTMIPETRVSFIICWRLIDQGDLQSFKKYVEMIQCRVPSSEASIILVATCRDLVKMSDQEVLSAMTDVEFQLNNFISMLETNDARRPRITMKFAISAKDRTVLCNNSKIKKMPDLLNFFGDHAVTRCKGDPDYPHCLVPQRVMHLEKKILEVKSQGRWILPSSEYKVLARIVDSRYDKNVDELHRHTQLLQSWSDLHHMFRHIFVKKYIVLDVSWVFRVITCLGCCIPPKTHYIQSSELNRMGSDDSPLMKPANRASVSASSPPPPLFPSQIFGFGERLPFNLSIIRQKDPFSLLSRGIMIIEVAQELFRTLLAEKRMDARDIHKLFDLLEKYDLVMPGSKIMTKSVDNTSFHQSPLMNRKKPTMNEEEEGEERDKEEDSTAYLVESSSEEEDDMEGDEYQRRQELFYLIPACFNAQVPTPVTLHLQNILFGPSYRFALNIVPPYFFARLVARIAIYAKKIYVGPVTTCSQLKEQAGPLVTQASFWCNCVWVVSSDASRALIRMVHRSLFVTFHDHHDDEAFLKNTCRGFAKCHSSSSGSEITALRNISRPP